jgi:hypothetical protein
MDWNRDAVLSEKAGFDCSKGHPAQGNYHHHQNPSAFKLDLTVISTICNLYDADGLYLIDSNSHSPLIGFAYDGFPIYGAYGYKNSDGTGGIVRMKSGYNLRNISVRTTHADGAQVEDGPAVSATYPLGYFREDYEFTAHPGQDDFLDIHNGRFCITPEYPSGTYAYFATVDENWNSAYPYVIGPKFYGNVTGGKVSSISESTTVYNPLLSIAEKDFNTLKINIFPNPASNLIAVQVGSLNTTDLQLLLLDCTGKEIQKASINKGQTIAYFDVQTVYAGIYMLKIYNQQHSITQKVVIEK